MTENWILNASPLILLARIGREELLLTLSDQVVVPQAVAEEIEAGPAQDQARQALVAGWFTVVDTPPPSPELLSWDLGRGETAVLSLAITERAGRQSSMMERPVSALEVFRFKSKEH